MSGADAVLLARAQFAFTVGFHIVLPAFTIGLASYLAVLEGLWLSTGRQVYLDVFQYWLRAFAVVFGMGVVSGVVMAYEFGTNWAHCTAMSASQPSPAPVAIPCGPLNARQCRIDGHQRRVQLNFTTNPPFGVLLPSGPRSARGWCDRLDQAGAGHRCDVH